VSLDAFTPGAPESFRNGLIDLEVWQVPRGAAGLSVVNPCGLPVEVQGLLILAHKRSGILEIGARGQALRVTTGIQPNGKQPALFRYLSLQAATGRTLRLEPGAAITLRWTMTESTGWADRLPWRVRRLGDRIRAAVGLRPVAGHDHGFVAAVPPHNRSARGSKIAAVLVETI
jgi:hypothetical protein